ncbi:MAG TPA: NYN domain-containing protein [Ktedonobacteraceae bacterium]
MASGEEVAEVKEAVQEAKAEEPVSTEQEVPPEVPAGIDVPQAIGVAEDVVATSTTDIRQPDLLEADAAALFPLEVETPLSAAEAVRPFTDFIEEFRQTEAQFGSFKSESESTFTTFVAGSESLHEPLTFLETAPEDLARVVEEISAEASTPAPEAAPGDESSAAPANQAEANPSGLTQPRMSSERPVSPLLRPATRPRLPRHGRHRIDELIHPAELRGDLAKTPAPAPVEEPVSTPETPAVAEPKPEEQPARPARRYRFDRPATTASATPAAAKSATSTRASETKEKRGFAATRAESTPAPEPAAPDASRASAMAEPVAAKETAPVVESAPAAPAPAVPATERRRRGNHERTREKEQPAVAAPVAVPEPVAPVVEPAPAIVEEIAVEDLPPLEYSELQAANSRRRRRRRTGTPSTPVAPSSNGTLAHKAPISDLVPPAAASSLPAPIAPKAVPTLPPSAYNIVSGYTVSQMNQGNDVSGPFMGPEPSPARGSTFTPSPIRHVRNEALRSTPAHTSKHSESPVLSGASVNHLANVVSQAMQTQTDRMVAELRRANQVPTNVSVSLPPFPSTERVGVFVDVANLLYSARTLRITVDFGKLLDFLRGNRRLVRAQAYCPTSPQPGDDQMFLQAVKGLGYRITTKNYKTFSSGAKKADLDLDLCMDVVRLVDGKAVDCIVLVSGDSDFMPMLDYCSDHGVRVEVAAFDESMSATLRQSCDLFVNLSMLEEIRL